MEVIVVVGFIAVVVIVFRFLSRDDEVIEALEPRTSSPRPRRVVQSAPRYKPQEGLPANWPSTPPVELEPCEVSGKCYVIDGDTIVIKGERIRLAGIDAPELEHPWGKKAKWELVQICKSHTITARLEPDISYDRVVATCFLPDGRDLSAVLVERGLALDWPKFSGGKYSHLEPVGVRKKHWKAAARQRGHMHIFHK